MNMKFEVSANLVYKALSPSTLILNVQPFKSSNQLVFDEALLCTPELKMTSVDAVSREKRFKIIEIDEVGEVNINYTAIIENEVKVIPGAELDDVPISKMPAPALFYLNPSRYCQSDKLYKFAYNKFGHIEHAYDKVIAIRDWIYANVEYSSGYTTAQTSAFDTITEQIGVCRDFAHLGVALCRALTIPARYFTCYAYQLRPQDFHACFEAYLGGHWIVVDATKLAPINGLIKIASGADATDTALASIFGNLQFYSLVVNTNLLSPEFPAVDYTSSQFGYSYSL
jgi:transglutaminase-like putative cysteine protease